MCRSFRGPRRPSTSDAPDDLIAAEAQRIGYPLVVKAVAGGGGKGMRTVASPAELPAAIRTARSEAGSAFGDSAVYLERRLMTPRHIEIQLLGDHHGTVLPFVERECSIQRRHQKVVEESPSMAIDERTRRAMAECAARVARSVGYTNAGTIEFLFDDSTGVPEFFFLEMNTRLQVEHPVTEAVTGIDLVHWQIRIALGERLDRAARTGPDAAGTCDRVPHLRRGSGRRLHARRPAWCARSACRVGRAFATIAAWPPGSRCRCSTTR